MTEQKLRGKRSAGKIQKYCCKSKLLPVVSQHCILQTSLMVLFSLCWGAGCEQEKLCWRRANTSSAAAPQSPGHCCSHRHSCLCSPPPHAPGPWNMPHDQPLAAELRSHSTLLGIGLPFQPVACILFTNKRRKPTGQSQTYVQLPQVCRGWRTAARNADSPTSPLTQHSSVDFNYFIKEHANSLLWYKSPV